MLERKQITMSKGLADHGPQIKERLGDILNTMSLHKGPDVRRKTDWHAEEEYFGRRVSSVKNVFGSVFDEYFKSMVVRTTNVRV